MGISNATPLSVDFYDLKSMSFKFGNDIFIIFEMPRVTSICNQRFLANSMIEKKRKKLVKQGRLLFIAFVLIIT